MALTSTEALALGSVRDGTSKTDESASFSSSAPEVNLAWSACQCNTIIFTKTCELYAIIFS